MKRARLLDAVAAYFKEHPNHWIDGRELSTVGGAYAWRSRVSECRTKLGLAIQNRERRVTFQNGDVFTVSEYRLVTEPQEAPDLPAERYTQQPGLW